jgi:hypothetical protein
LLGKNQQQRHRWTILCLLIIKNQSVNKMSHLFGVGLNIESNRINTQIKMHL